VIDKPLYQNPLGGGGTLNRLSERIGGLSFRQEGDMGRYVADNDPGGIAAGFSSLEDYLAAGNKLPEFAKSPEPLKAVENPALANSIIGNGFYEYNKNLIDGGGYFNVTPPSTPVSEQTPLPGIIDDPANLGSAGGPSLFPFPGMDGTETAIAPSSDTIVSPLQTVQGPEDTLNPYNRVGQQLTGPNQDDILGTLKNIEQGIASLGQGGMNKSSFGGFNNNFGIGSFFPPYGGMYG
jgi:hypothetical protein